MRKSKGSQKKHTVASIEEKMLKALIKQKGKYERYLKTQTLEGIDHKAEHAYTHIIKTIIELSRKSTITEEKSPEEMRQAAAEILESEYGIKI